MKDKRVTFKKPIFFFPSILVDVISLECERGQRFLTEATYTHHCFLSDLKNCLKSVFVTKIAILDRVRDRKATMTIGI